MKNNNSILDLLVLYNPVNNKKRYGSSADGGYVIVQGYTYDHYFGCGVADNISFDVNVFNDNLFNSGTAFDGTISNSPNFPKNIQFVNKNISINNTNKTTNLENETTPYENILIKMDIEGHEWKWINAFTKMNKIKQFVIEVHGLFDMAWCSLANYEYSELEAALQKINKTHYLVHFHSNAGAEYKTVNNKQYPTVAELTFIRKNDCAIDGFNKTILPINGLDFKNGHDREDLFFDSYPFVQ